MKKLFLGLLFAPALVFGQTCPVGQVWDNCSGPQFGGGGCIPFCRDEAIVPPGVGPFGPAELCINAACSPVVYFWVGAKAVAESRLPNGYEVMGWAGPCLSENRSQCQDIFNQAFYDLHTHALRATRAQTFTE